MQPFHPHMASTLHQQRERELRRAAESARVLADGKAPSRSQWRDWLRRLRPRRRPDTTPEIRPGAIVLGAFESSGDQLLDRDPVTLSN